MNKTVQRVAGDRPLAGPVDAADFGSLDFGEHGQIWSGYPMTDGYPTTNAQLPIAGRPAITGIFVSIDGGRNGLQPGPLFRQT